MQKKFSSRNCVKLNVLNRPLVLIYGYKQKKWKTESNIALLFVWQK